MVRGEGVDPNRERGLGEALPEDGGRGHQGHGGIAAKKKGEKKSRLEKLKS